MVVAVMRLCSRIWLLQGRISKRRMFHIIMVFLLTLLIIGASLTTLLPKVMENDIILFQRETKHPSFPEEAFTIVMQTFNRTDLLLKLLNHYQAVPHLREVVVVWNNLGEKVPRDLWESLGPHAVQVTFVESTVNKMRNRLQPFPSVETKAILMLDDDLLISAHDLTFAFSVWQQFPDQIVGFIPRKHISSPSGIYSYGSFELQNPEMGNGDMYSMVLIGAAFFHRKYLNYFQKEPSAVYTLIDETQNCDDIAMNFMIAEHLKKPSGVFVKPVDMRNLEKDAISGYSGMWHRAEHMLQRSYCLNKLVDIYGNMPLKYSNIMISQFGFPNYANHKSKC
ncbi:exostosin-like 2 [Protopterus annectens]|uniref:exostosin-like 2 n=1 Tax=Protopterus annectens TaxID=7888 RepID=UPI001CFB76BE|nr:exostosin-like 2 [Protopterus annectens]